MSGFPPALLRLYALRMRGLLRAVLRAMRTLRGAVMTLLTAGVLASAFGPGLAIALHRGAPPAWGAAAVQHSLPLGLLGLWILNLLTPSGEVVLYFSPPEIDFLFQAPFSRRQLLLYKLIGFGSSALLLALPLSLWVCMFVDSWFWAWAALALALFFLNGLTLCAELLALIAATRGFARGRALAGIVLAALLCIGVLQAYARSRGLSFAELAELFPRSPLGRALLAPLLVFAKVATAVTPAEALAWTALALGIVIATYTLALSLDANYLEAAVAVSRRVQARAARVALGGSSPSKPARGSRLTSWPWLLGLGPVVSLQLGLLRRGTRAATSVVLLALAFCVVLAFVVDMRDDRAVPLTAVGVLCYATFMFSTHLPLAFRGDPRHIELLKQLPIRPSAIVGGQLAAVSAAVCVVHFGVLGALIVLFPSGTHTFLGAAAFSPPFNLLVLALENLIFLFFPSSAPVAGTASAAQAGRVIAVAALKLFVVSVVAGTAIGLAVSVRLVHGSNGQAFAVAWVVVALAAIVVTLAAARRFRKLDVSLDVIE